MPKISFRGAEYNRVEDMPPDVRAEYDKAVQMLPDRDNNGIPDLLESDSARSSTTSLVTPGTLPNVAGTPLPPQAEKVMRLATKGIRIGRWVYAGIMISVVVCILLFMFGIVTLIKSSGSYQLLVNTARSNPEIQSILGAPVRDGWFPAGSTSESGSSGTADFTISLTGSKKSGTLHATAVKVNNEWKVQSMILESGGESYQIQ